MQIYAPAPLAAPQDENALVASFFGTQTDGYFVEIGAFDGVAYSTTRPLWERGWSGMLIEPDPVTYQRLLANYPDKSRLTFLNAAVCMVDAPTDFYQHNNAEHCGWHSLDPAWIATWAPGSAKRITVPGVRFSSLRFPRAIDFLSIDAEGYDGVILESMPLTIRPRLIMLEVDKNGVRERVEREMKKRGYVFLWGSYLNSAYVPK